MATQEKRGPIDEVAERARKFLEELDRLLHPEPKREPARVPIPIRKSPSPRRRSR